MHVFHQNRIALVWDFDKTLIPDYMQKPLFDHYEINQPDFWQEVNQKPVELKAQGYRVNEEIYYLNHILSYVESGRFEGLNNNKLRELGSKIKFFEGVLDFFYDIKSQIESDPAYKPFDIKVEHYIVSTGLTEMIRGSDIMPHIKDVWGCEFIESDNKLSQIVYTIDNTTKTKALFEINKGVNEHPDDISVNALIPENERRIPFNNMIYIADGPSDIPAFSVVKRLGGLTFAVYKEGDNKSFEQADNLRKDGRIDMFGPANFIQGSLSQQWLSLQVQKIAKRISDNQISALKSTGAGIPKHIVEKK